MSRHKIISVREAPEGFGEKTIGLVSFNYEPTQFDGPIEITRWSESKKREFTIAKIVGANAVAIIDAQVCQGERAPYILTNSLHVPDEVRFAVAEEAFKALQVIHEQKKHAPAANGQAKPSWPNKPLTAPAGSVDTTVPF